MEKDELKELLYETIENECQKQKIVKPDFIREDEWFTAFEVIEAHYLANNIMDNYLKDLSNYIREVIIWTDVEPEWDASTILAGSSAQGVLSVEDKEELCAIAEEILDRTMKLSQKSKQLKK